MRCQLPKPAINACKVGLLHAGGGLPCRPHQRPHNLLLLLYIHMNFTGVVSRQNCCVCSCLRQMHDEKMTHAKELSEASAKQQVISI